MRFAWVSEVILSGPGREKARSRPKVTAEGMEWLGPALSIGTLHRHGPERGDRAAKRSIANSLAGSAPAKPSCAACSLPRTRQRTSSSSRRRAHLTPRAGSHVRAGWRPGTVRIGFVDWACRSWMRGLRTQCACSRLVEGDFFRAGLRFAGPLEGPRGWRRLEPPRGAGAPPHCAPRRPTTWAWT